MSDSLSMMRVLEGYLQVTNSRHTMVVNNVANIDTPGYHTQDIDFKGALAASLSGAAPTNAAVAHEVQGLLQRPDGNNVSLDRESLALSETQLQFRIGVQLIKSEFHRLLTAINEGKS